MPWAHKSYLYVNMFSYLFIGPIKLVDNLKARHFSRRVFTPPVGRPFLFLELKARVWKLSIYFCELGWQSANENRSNDGFSLFVGWGWLGYVKGRGNPHTPHRISGEIPPSRPYMIGWEFVDSGQVSYQSAKSNGQRNFRDYLPHRVAKKKCHKVITQMWVFFFCFWWGLCLWMGFLTGVVLYNLPTYRTGW